MKKIIIGSALVLMLGTALPSMAQPNAGDWEFTLAGTGDVNNDFDSGGFGINGSAGYFFSPNFELALRQAVGFEGHTSLEQWSGSTRGAVDWHFIFGKFVPFIGGNFGIDYNENDSSWGIGPEFGFKYYVHERTFILAMAEYRWNFDELENIDNNADHGRFVMTIGVGFTLGGRR